jgi:hypothetical protein
MTKKPFALAAVAAMMLAAGPVAFAAESETEVLVSGDEPMNPGAEKEIKNPVSDAAEQMKTDAVEAESKVMVSGDEPMDPGSAKEVANPMPDAAEQAKTQEQMEKVDDASGAISGKYE